MKTVIILLLTLTLIGCGGSSSPVTPPATPVVTPPPPAPTASLTASPTTVAAGQSTTLTWQTTNATTISIAGIGSVAANGSESVAPTASINYTLTAKGAGGTQVVMAQVTVTSPPPSPPPPPPPAIPTSWTTTDLPPLPGYLAAQANAVNSAGIAVGYSVTNGVAEATEWIAGSPIDLGPGQGMAINAAGQVAGFSSDSEGVITAHLWWGGIDTELGNWLAVGINDSEEVVGYDLAGITAYSWTVTGDYR
jgi:hypothetical protein